ncbi:MAG TPA: hypothetical protein VMY34_08585 [Acidimicrobiales bacterium]|nr:hypothetical protein [Acidimicrobiales bacterium]
MTITQASSGPVKAEVSVGESAESLERRAAEILAARAGVRLGHAVEVVEGGAARVTLGTTDSSAAIRRAVDHGSLAIPADPHGFGLAPRGDGAIMLGSAGEHGLMAGVGHVLRASSFVDGEWQLPSDACSSAPAKAIRPIYFATHFGNWYCHAEETELRTYIEDLALDGYNELVTWFDLHHFRSFDDGAEAWDRLVRVDRMARDVGMRVGRVAIANESFEGQASPELRAVGRLAGTGYDTDLCPSKPEARRIILENKRAFLERTRDTTALDWVCLWPYDQGGCNCDDCAPWPRTYLDLCRDIASLVGEVLPGTRPVVSAWWIGTHVASEDDAFFECLERGETWFDTIMSGTVELRRWLADGRKVPDRYGVLLFPEISMFDAIPWGGRGANPAPRKFEREMAELGEHIAGAMPYSEGRYEDLNKFVWSRLQWEPDADVADIVEEYCRYHFGVEVAVDAAALVFEVEAGIRDLPTAASRLGQAVAIEARMDDKARRSWRWAVLRARVEIDALRYDLERGSPAQRAEVGARLRDVYDHLQRHVYRHDPDRSLRYWIYTPYEEWITVPLNELVLPTGSSS